jgi:two-component system, LytTR family, response regulator
MDHREAGTDAIARLLERVLPARHPLRRLVVRADDRLLLVPLHEVVHLEADGNYVRVHTATGVHQLRDTLSHLETMLDPDRFVRIHRGEIVNLDAVRAVEPYFHGDFVLLLKNGEKLRLSRRYRDRVLGVQS